MEEQLTEHSSFFFVVERDEYFNQFDCDKDLNRVCPYVEEMEEGNCYLITKDEIEAIKGELIGKTVTLKIDEDDNDVIDKYEIIPVDDLISLSWTESDFEDDDCELRRECSCDGDFIDAMYEKYDGNYYNEIVRRALERSRIFNEFIDAMNDINEEDYEEWKTEIGRF